MAAPVGVVNSPVTGPVQMGTPRQQPGCGRRWDGHFSMSHPNGAAADCHCRSQHSRNAQAFDTPHGANNIHNGIHRADLMKMNGFNGRLMNRSLFNSDSAKSGNGALLNHICKRAGLNNTFDFRKSAMGVAMRFFMGMVVIVHIMHMVVMMAVVMAMAMGVPVRLFVHGCIFVHVPVIVFFLMGVVMGMLMRVVMLMLMRVGMTAADVVNAYDRDHCE